MDSEWGTARSVPMGGPLRGFCWGGGEVGPATRVPRPVRLKLDPATGEVGKGLRQDVGVHSGRGLAQGFTLIELLLVAVVIGILVSIATPNYRTCAMRATCKSMKAQLPAL